MRAFAAIGVRSKIINNNNTDASPSSTSTTINSKANENAFVPSRSRPAATRPALQTIDHNAMRQMPCGNGNMSYDKPNGYGAKPLMPTISKTAIRTPLRPRVAGAGTPVTATTPLARTKNITPATSSREGISTPFLGNNITPRSGKRNSRVDSTNTTPIGTPSRAPASPADELFRVAQDTPLYGLGGGEGDVTKRSTVSFNTNVPDGGISNNTSQASVDSKFFFASEAKTVPPSRPQLPPKASSSFVYANGTTETIATPQSSSVSAIGSTVGEERSQPKFFHANGIPDLQPSPVLHVQPPKRPGSTISTSSRMTSPMLAHHNTLPPQSQRPLSPTKSAQAPPLSSPRPIPNLSSPLVSRPQHVGRGQSANSVVAARRASIEATQKSVTHGRSSSVSSPDMSANSRRISSGSSFEAMSPTPLLSALNSPLVSTSEDAQEDVEAASDTLSELPSPIKAGHSLERMNELAADARRERKVLDLEITNSSLEAINRTLEREMRKQTAELRRYRRLSRSGRLSIATSGSRRTSGNLSLVEGEDGTMLSDMSEEEEESEEEMDDSESDSPEDGTLSPKAMAESDLRHRKRDEKRLQLDLSKHQQLLTDSQRMNQSLKRCLGWTEVLIDEGKKALAYSVKVSDVALGGRVLLPEELEEAEDNEGMSPAGFLLLKQARIAASAVWGGEERDDRDSGIEVDGPQRSPVGTFEHLPQ